MEEGPRIRVSALIRRRGRILLCRHEKDGAPHWLLPGGGVGVGESLTEALRRELAEEVGIVEDASEVRLDGPIALVDSIAPEGSSPRRHVLHVIFAADVPERSLERISSVDGAVRGHGLFEPDDLDGIVLHPPIQEFLRRWEPHDPVAYLGKLWLP